MSLSEFDIDVLSAEQTDDERSEKFTDETGFGSSEVGNILESEY